MACRWRLQSWRAAAATAQRAWRQPFHRCAVSFAQFCAHKSSTCRESLQSGPLLAPDNTSSPGAGPLSSCMRPRVAIDRPHIINNCDPTLCLCADHSFGVQWHRCISVVTARRRRCTCAAALRGQLRPSLRCVLRPAAQHHQVHFVVYMQLFDKQYGCCLTPGYYLRATQRGYRATAAGGSGSSGGKGGTGGLPASLDVSPFASIAAAASQVSLRAACHHQQHAGCASCDTCSEVLPPTCTLILHMRAVPNTNACSMHAMHQPPRRAPHSGPLCAQLAHHAYRLRSAAAASPPTSPNSSSSLCPEAAVAALGQRQHTA